MSATQWQDQLLKQFDKMELEDQLLLIQHLIGRITRRMHANRPGVEHDLGKLAEDLRWLEPYEIPDDVPEEQLRPRGEAERNATG